MYCPLCRSDQVIVNNSRPTRKNTQIWRRRKCLKCGSVFTTREKMTASFIVIEKRDGRHVKYSHSKLFASIYRSFIGKKKSDYGGSAKVAEDLTQKIEEILISQNLNPIKTSNLVNISFKIISKQHPDSALRYFVYFYQFTSIDEYFQKIKLILK